MLRKTRSIYPLVLWSVIRTLVGISDTGPIRLPMVVAPELRMWRPCSEIDCSLLLELTWISCR
jgi:hypothetical protein